LEAWEIYLDQRRQEATVLEVIEARKRQLQIGKVLLSKGLEGLLALKPTIARKNAAGEMEHILCIKPSDLVKLVEVGVRFVKDALGEVDEDKPTKFELICGLRKSAARDGILRAAGSRATAGDRGGVRVLIGVISGALGAVPGQNSPACPKSCVCEQGNPAIFTGQDIKHLSQQSRPGDWVSCNLMSSGLRYHDGASCWSSPVNSLPRRSW
jgi:hypothetical protein